jgi:hypothetical protein
MKALFLFIFVVSAHADNFAWNASVSPLRFVVGPNVRVDRRVSDFVSVGVFGAWMDHSIKAVYFNGGEVGAAATYAFAGAFREGWIVEGAVKYADLRTEITSSAGDVYLRHLVNWGGRVVGGYRWYWGHFNLGVEAGAEGNSAGGQTIFNSLDDREVKIPLYPIAFYGDLSVGFAF